MLGYELAVSAVVDGKPVSTKLRVAPGEVPDLRLRVTPILAKHGVTDTGRERDDTRAHRHWRT